MKTIQINHENVGKYTVRPMDPSWVLEEETSQKSPTKLVANLHGRCSSCLEFADLRPFEEWIGRSDVFEDGGDDVGFGWLISKIEKNTTQFPELDILLIHICI